MRDMTTGIMQRFVLISMRCWNRLPASPLIPKQNEFVVFKLMPHKLALPLRRAGYSDLTLANIGGLEDAM